MGRHRGLATEASRLGVDDQTLDAHAFIADLESKARRLVLEHGRFFTDPSFRPLAFQAGLLESGRREVVTYQERCLDTAATDMGLTRGFVRCLLYLDASERHVGHGNDAFALLSAVSPNASQHGILMGRFEAFSALFPPMREDDPDDRILRDKFCAGTRQELDAVRIAAIFHVMCRALDASTQ